MSSLAARPPLPSAEDAIGGLVDVSDGLGQAFFSVAQRTLHRLIARPESLAAALRDDVKEFSRQLLFTDPVQRFGVWILSWPPGYRTPIHSHHCSCAFAIYKGRIDEIFYDVGQEGSSAVPSEPLVRAPGYVGGAPLESGVVHEMVNPTESAAISVHIYGYRPDRYENSIERVFHRNA